MILWDKAPKIEKEDEDFFFLLQSSNVRTDLSFGMAGKKMESDQVSFFNPPRDTKA